MSDEIEIGNNLKLLWSVVKDKDLMQFRAVLERDRLKRFSVLSHLLFGYINDEPEIREYINRVCQNRYTKRVNKSRKIAEEAAVKTDQFFTEDELNSIYDFLENEDTLED